MSSVCVLASLILSGRGWSVFLCLLNCVSRVKFICVIVSYTECLGLVQWSCVTYTEYQGLVCVHVLIHYMSRFGLCYPVSYAEYQGLVCVRVLIHYMSRFGLCYCVSYPG